MEHDRYPRNPNALEKLQKACAAVDTSDLGLLKRLLCDVVERCGWCKARPATKHYWEAKTEKGGECAFDLCCDECLNAVESEANAKGGKFYSRDTKDAALVRQLVARVGPPGSEGADF